MAAAVQRLLRRLPLAAGRPARVTGRRIYLLPTRAGAVFALLLLTMLVAAINYASNPAFLLTFLLAGLYLQTIFHTWRNLRGVEVVRPGGERAFAGDPLPLVIELRAGGRARHDLNLAQGKARCGPVDLAAGETRRCTLHLPTRRRGPLQPGVVVLESRHPLGLVRAWTRLVFEEPALVWPALPPQAAVPPPAPGTGRDAPSRHEPAPGTDDFCGYRDYRPGDAPARLHWKALAGEKGLLVKHFCTVPGGPVLLDFHALAPADPETRLQLLAAGVERLSAEGRPFGLRLPDTRLEPESGAGHRRRCLDALARFGTEAPR